MARDGPLARDVVEVQKIDRAVGAQRDVGRRGREAARAAAGFYQDGDGVSKIILALRVVVLDAAQRVEQRARLEPEGARIDLVDRRGRVVAVGLLDDGGERAVAAHDAAVAGGVGHDGADDRHVVAVLDVLVERPADRFDVDKRSVSAKHKGIAVLPCFEEIPCAHDRVPRSETLFLFTYFAARGRLLDVVAARHNADIRDARLLRRVHDPRQHGLERHLAKHLGRRRVHALPLARGENDTIQFQHVLAHKHASL